MTWQVPVELSQGKCEALFEAVVATGLVWVSSGRVKFRLAAVACVLLTSLRAPSACSTLCRCAWSSCAQSPASALTGLNRLQRVSRTPSAYLVPGTGVGLSAIKWRIAKVLSWPRRAIHFSRAVMSYRRAPVAPMVQVVNLEFYLCFESWVRAPGGSDI